MSNQISNNAQTANVNVNGFQIQKIIFDDSNFATLWVSARIENCLKESHFVIPFNLLNDLLRFCGNTGEKVLLKMLDIMMLSSKPPYVLDIASDLDMELVITCVKLKLEHLWGALNEAPCENCYLVQEVSPINLLQQAKNMQQHVRDFKTEIIETNTQHNNLEQLCTMYGYYLGLLELDIKESAARSKAKLSDPRIYSLAAIAHQTFRGKTAY